MAADCKPRVGSVHIGDEEQCGITLEGADKWVMSKFKQTPIPRPFFDIFERLPKTRNFVF